MKRVAVLAAVLFVSTLFTGCSSMSSWTRFSIAPNSEWQDTHLTIVTGNSKWCNERLDGKQYITLPQHWEVLVDGSGIRDGADRWWPDLVDLGASFGGLDGMWAGWLQPGSPKTTTDGKVSFTKYTLRWSNKLQTFPVIEIGNQAWCDSLGDWKVGMRGRCYPYRYHIQVRSTKRTKDGHWVPETNSDTLGHEIMHFPGLGGNWHDDQGNFILRSAMRTYNVQGMDPKKFWVE